MTLNRFSLIAMMGVVLVFLASCGDKELDKWELVQLQTNHTATDGTYKAATTTVDIETNSAWSISLPDWMHTDRTEGFGNAQVQVNIDVNEGPARSDAITITAGSEDGAGNVAGFARSAIGISQATKASAVKFEITAAEISRTFHERKYEGRYYTDYYKYGGTITYTITSDMSDSEISELISKLYLKLELSQSYWLGTKQLPSLSLANGTHTVEFDDVIDVGRSLIKVSLEYTQIVPDGVVHSNTYTVYF